MADMNSLNRPSYNPALIVPPEHAESPQEREKPDMYTRIAELSKSERAAYIEALENKIEALRAELLVAYQFERENRHGDR